MAMWRLTCLTNDDERSEFAHTIENASDAPVTYLMFKWQTDRNASGPLLGNQVAAAEADAGGADALVATGIWDGPTKHLGHLHCHVTTLQPGAGYDPHADSYDVAIALLEGTVETLGERVSAPAAIFYPAGTLHGMRNPGEGRASYAVFELHRRARPSTGPR